MSRSSVVKSSFPRRMWRSLVYVLAGLLLLVMAVIGLFRFVNPPTSAFMLANQWGHPERPIRQRWIGLEDMSPWMPLAVIASEDQHFQTHWGFDVDAIATAVEEYQRGEGLRGASTISQQTAKNLFLWGGRQFVRKALEAGLTVGLEALWPKRRIMEVYLNIAELGDGIYGVEAASQHHFGASAQHLTMAQAARLAAVLPNPKARNAGSPSGYVLERAKWITRQMRQLGGVAHVRAMVEP